MRTPAYATIALVVLGAVLLAPTRLEAQKNCQKGIPCGNSCISAAKTCRIGTPTTQPVPRDDPPASQPDYVEPTTATPAIPVAATAHQWVGQPHGRTYYLASCQAAKELPEPIYFSTTADAERLGYRRSRVPTC